MAFSFGRSNRQSQDSNLDSSTAVINGAKDAHIDWENNQAKIYFHDSGIRDSRVDSVTGLYTYIFGTTRKKSVYYYLAYNQTVTELVKKYGFPPYSYHKWIDLIENPSNFFLTNEKAYNLHFDTTYLFPIDQDTIAFRLSPSFFESTNDTFGVCIAYSKPVIDSVYILANAIRESTFKFCFGPESSNLAFLVFKCVLFNRETITSLDIVNRKKLSEQALIKEK